MFTLSGKPELVAKLIYPAGRSKDKFEKLRAMIARPPAGAYELVDGFPVLTWPRSLLFDASETSRRARPAGYTMARIQGRDFVPFYRVTSAARRSELGGPMVTWDRLVLMGIRLCHVVRTLHRLDYAVGDMNDRNVLVSRRFTPLFMDTDSFQVPKPGFGHFPCVVGDQMYWPPEHLDLDYATFRGSRVSGDKFALGVLLFQLFMNGLRPYQARGSAVEGLEALVDKTRAGHYPWGSPQPGVLEPPAGSPRYEGLPRPIRSAFERCFVKGHKHPGRRPSAEDWYVTLRRVNEAGYRTCPRLATHVVGALEGDCPWCEDPYNMFGLPKGRRRPRPAAQRHAPGPRPGPGPARPSAGPWSPASARAVASRPRAARRRSRGSLRSIGRLMGSVSRLRPWRPLDPRLARGAWLALVALVCAVPLVLLPALLLGPSEQFVLFGFTAVWVGAGATAAAWRWIGAGRTRLLIVAIATATGAVLALVISRSVGWDGVAYAVGAGSLALGLGTFGVLERGRHRAFWPSPRGAFHAVIGWGLAFLPVVTLWFLTRS